MNLVTLGCSWTFGIGCGYEKGENINQFKEHLRSEENANKYSFRAILSERHGYINHNLSRGGSSNQMQFRRATKYFTKRSQEKTIVLWGITSTARNELYLVKHNQLKNIHYNTIHKKVNGVEYAENFYNHEHEVKLLAHQMLHWNLFFESLGIENYWFDTFNTHKYPLEIPRLLPVDLLTRMTVEDQTYHESTWQPTNEFTGETNITTERRIRLGVLKELLNPHSKHPTKKGHVMIAKILDELIR
tara:strand:+ start:44 stop:778 length:735 start_codon:yes stop_codon:yes gene_type:complete